MKASRVRKDKELKGCVRGGESLPNILARGMPACLEAAAGCGDSWTFQDVFRVRCCATTIVFSGCRRLQMAKCFDLRSRRLQQRLKRSGLGISCD